MSISVLEKERIFYSVGGEVERPEYDTCGKCNFYVMGQNKPTAPRAFSVSIVNRTLSLDIQKSNVPPKSSMITLANTRRMYPSGTCLPHESMTRDGSEVFLFIVLTMLEEQKLLALGLSQGPSHTHGAFLTRSTSTKPCSANHSAIIAGQILRASSSLAAVSDSVACGNTCSLSNLPDSSGCASSLP